MNPVLLQLILTLAPKAEQVILALLHPDGTVTVAHTLAGDAAAASNSAAQAITALQAAAAAKQK